MKMTSLNLGNQQSDYPASFHGGGDCRCDRRHQTMRSYLKYGLCLNCGCLTPYVVRPLKITDPFLNLWRKRNAKPEPERQAVSYLRAWMSPDLRLRAEQSMRIDEPTVWHQAHHFGMGKEVRNALRKVGFNDRSFRDGSLDDVYLLLLRKALGKAEE